jgi:hypothetical protein
VISQTILAKLSSPTRPYVSEILLMNQNAHTFHTAFFNCYCQDDCPWLHWQSITWTSIQKDIPVTMTIRQKVNQEDEGVWTPGGVILAFACRDCGGQHDQCNSCIENSQHC